MTTRFRLDRFAGCLAAILLIGLLVAPAARAQWGGLYFPATGHNLTDAYGFFTFWQAHDGARLLGAPVTEALPTDTGAIQYFENGRLEQQIDPASGTSTVRTGRVGAEYAEALWRRFAPAPPRRPSAGEQVFETTGHTLREPFLGFWQAAGGQEFFGPPISEPLWEATAHGRRQVQYFERARLERDAQAAGTPGELQVSTLGRALALLRGVETAPVSNQGFESFGPAAPLVPDIATLNPTPRPAPTAVPPAAAPATPAQPAAPRPAQPRSSSGDKYIVVNLSNQWLYAYEGKQIVFDAPVTTGRDGMNTPTGNFAIYAKVKLQTMDGVLDGVPWEVPNVPNVMYINGDVAMHGTYWHNRFGSGARLSHGCINLSLKAAAWLYDWAPVGTAVRVKY